MVHQDTSARSKPKPRGRPKHKANEQGDNTGKVLDSTRSESGSTGPNMKIKVGPLTSPEQLSMSLTGSEEGLKPILKNLQATEVPIEQEESKELELIESMEFLNGGNKLAIKFLRRHNRMFRIQIFLNDEIEIRPVTYTGASTGYSFWNLLKGALKK